MVFNDSFLFIHVPKAAGISLTNALLNALPGPLVNTVPDGHAEPVAGERVMSGLRHETLPQADAWLKAHGWPEGVARFKTILTVVRDPYAMELSRFHYLQEGYPWDQGPAMDLARQGDFPRFAIESTWWFQDIRDFYELDGRVPDTMRICRFETLAADAGHGLADVFVRPFVLPRLNATRHGDARALLTPEAEAAIYRKYQWLFDRGYYSRAWPQDGAVSEPSPATHWLQGVRRLFKRP